MEENKTELTKYLATARETKKYSQRKLARAIGVHHSTLNEIEKGNIKKPDVEILRKIAEELDISLEVLLKLSGYNEFAIQFSHNTSDTKSTKDLKNKINELEQAQMDLLAFDSDKRQLMRKEITKINNLKKDIEVGNKINDEDIIKILDEFINNTKPIMQKYDYNKLP